MQDADMVQTKGDDDLREVLLGDDGRISEDIHCLTCGYNLRTLLPDVNCPECGMEVALSIRGDYLRFSQPDWVKKISAGMTCIWAYVVICLLLVIGMFLFGVLAATVYGNGGGTGRSAAATFGVVIAIVAIVALLTAFILFIVGVIKITAAEPGSLVEENTLSARVLARYSMAVMLVLIVVGIAVVQLGDPMATGAMNVVQGVVQLVFLFSMLIYLRKMALRVPDLSLGKQTKIVMWGWAVIMFFGFIFPFIALLAMNSAPGGTPGAIAPMSGIGVGVLGCPLALGYLVFGIWSLVLIDKYKKTFKTAAQQAEETWERAMAGPEPVQDEMVDKSGSES